MTIWRKITHRSQIKEEKVSLTRTLFNYRMVPVTTVTLECGHQKVYRGGNVPGTKAQCKECHD